MSDPTSAVPVILWTDSSKSKLLALVMEGDALIRRDSVNAGLTWSQGSVVRSGITGFTAIQRGPLHYVQVLTWVNFLTDPQLGVYSLESP